MHLSTLNGFRASAKAADAGTLAAEVMGKKDVFTTAAIMKGEKGTGRNGRVQDEDATQLTALWVDIDRAGAPGHKTEGNLWTPDDLNELLAWLPIQPTVVIDSGGGWWLFFVLSEPVDLGTDGVAELLLDRWKCWWTETISEKFDRQMDSVFNTGRIIRAPGSINSKEDNRTAVVESIHPGRTYDLDELEPYLPPPEPPVSSSSPSVNGDRPGDEFNLNATVESMVALLEAEGFHSPRQLNGGRTDLTRPGKDAR